MGEWFLNGISLVFLSEVNIGNVNCAWATTLIFDTRTDVLVKVSMFLRQKMSRPDEDSILLHLRCNDSFVHLFILSFYYSIFTSYRSTIFSKNYVHGSSFGVFCGNFGNYKTINILNPDDAIWRHGFLSALVYGMASHLISAKPWFKLKLTYC